MNPFLNPYETPHRTIPFNQLHFEDYEPAMMEGMRLENEAIQQIIDNPDEPTFENTILPRTDETLTRVTNAFFNMLSACTSDEMDELAQKMSPLLTEHSNNIMMNEKLFARVKYVYEHHRTLTDEEQMLLDHIYEGFERNGATLPAEKKQLFTQLRVELSQLTLQFNQNMLKETNAYELHITLASQLAGLPDSRMEAAAQAAHEKGKEGWLFTLHAPSYGPFLTYVEDRELRHQIYVARNTICIHGNEHDNRDLVKRIVNMRIQIAQMLGYATYADYALTRRMAATTQNVYDLIDKLLDAYLPAARKEVVDIQEFARQETCDPQFILMPWDYAFYAHKLKKHLFDIDAEMLRPYFPLDKVKEGVFGLATRLYGITFRLCKDIQVYHPDVEAFEVFDKNGTFLAVLYTDFHPRDNKQSGAWMTNFQEQSIDKDGHNVRPHVSLVMNFSKPTAQKPALLTLGEVETFLHEFGHSLHSIFSQVRFESLSGTNVYWDFVELPSQIMENYATEPEFLHTFAFHYKTGEPIPEQLVERVRKANHFGAGYACIRQVSFCLLDMALYTQSQLMTEDVSAFESEAWQRAQLLPKVPDTCMTVQFGHIMSGGYAAGYYSYKWAEVLDADAFGLFQETGIFNEQTAARFRNELLSRGGTQHPMQLYTKFRGKQPTIDALLRRDGIIPNSLTPNN